MPKPNTLADDLTSIALRQLQQTWTFKLPRIQTIKKYRRLYNTEVQRKLRQQFNVPLPVFSGMIDTLQADLDDKLIIEYQNSDPADWKAIEKANAAIKQESESVKNQWDDHFQQYRFEKIITGRGIAKFTASNEGGYRSDLEVVTFEDFFFEPLGGGNLENHRYAGQQNIWRSKYELEKGVEDGLYDKNQVSKLTRGEGSIVKMSGLWDGEHDMGNRFKPLGLNPETNDFVGEEMFNLLEWVMEYKGTRWYILIEPFSGTWIRFDKNSNICSGDYLPWLSSASHKDIKNFASKSFADDLYPVADSIITLFNQDLTNRQKINLNARAYDKQMFKNVQKLDEAQHRPDALVPVDTLNGTRQISQGIYTFTTPQLTGTVDLIDWLQRDTGDNLGVTDMQKGASQAATKKVGVAYTELSQISKRLAFTSAPFVRMGQQLGERFLVSLSDYMKQPMAIKLLGEKGIEWDVLRRVDLNYKKTPEITVSSQMAQNDINEAKKQNKAKALEMLSQSQNINPKVRDEFIAREIGGFSEYDVALLLDVTNTTDKETMAEVSAAIQEIVLRGTKPTKNWNADRYFLRRLLDFAKKHKDTLPLKKYEMLIEYAQEHMEIVQENIDKEARNDVLSELRSGMPAAEPGADEINTIQTPPPQAIPVPAGAPSIPQPNPNPVLS